MKPEVLLSSKWKFAPAILLFTIGLTFLSCTLLFAQGSAGRIVGTITDANGGAVSGATVTILDVDRGTIAAPRLG